MSAPAFSVVLSVFDPAAAELEETVRSVLGQAVRDLELILVDDGSGAAGRAALVSLPRDPRARVLRNDRNLGLTKSLNRGLEAAQGKYIARVDSGDWWASDKLLKQLGFMEAKPGRVLCGTYAYFTDRGGRTFSTFRSAAGDAELRERLLLGDASFLHPTIVFRNDGTRYREFFRYSQDLDLYGRLMHKGELGNVPEHLVHVRAGPGAVSVSVKYYQRQYQRIAQECLEQRAAAGRDMLDEGRVPRVSDNPVGRFLCGVSGRLYARHLERFAERSLRARLLLVLSLAFYPPLLLDKLRGRLARRRASRAKPCAG